MQPHARETWLAIAIAPFYALVLDFGAILGAAGLRFEAGRPNIFLGFISVVPVIFMGLPLHSLWERGWRTVPALTALFAGHLAFGLNVALLLWVFEPTPWPFHRCAGLFPSVSFMTLTAGWLGAARLRSEPATTTARLVLVTCASLAGAAVVSIAIGPSIMYLIMAALNSWRAMGTS